MAERDRHGIALVVWIAGGRASGDDAALRALLRTLWDTRGEWAGDGRWLGVNHGAPARVHSPVKLGYKNTKYLTRVVFMPMQNGGYWSDQGYEWYGGT